MTPDVANYNLAVLFLFLEDGVDYVASNDIYTFTHIGEYIYVTIEIRDNLRHDGKRFFLFGILSTCGIDIWIQIFIWDDEWGRLKYKFCYYVLQPFTFRNVW